MIKQIRSNKKSFKTITFHEGFNIILADRERTIDSNESKNSRNGAGKSTLIEIIHFCLGASVSKNSIFKADELKGWSFSLVVELYKNDYVFTRYTDNANKIYIEGNASNLGVDTKYDKKQKEYYCGVTKLNEELLSIVYNLEKSDSRKYTPSFRELISYAVRRGIDGYRSAFEFFPKQKECSKQCCNAYFLGLNLDYASKFQEIKDKEKGIRDYKKATSSGIPGISTLKIGELNTTKITLEQEVEKTKEQLNTFNVHPQYTKITDEADELTKQIHKCINTLTIRKQLVENYESSLAKEGEDIRFTDVEKIYAEAGVFFESSLLKKIDEVMEFHDTIVKNRKEYLKSEVERIGKEIENLNQQIQQMSSERAELMRVLSNHGALEEYTALQEKFVILKQKLEDVSKSLESAKFIENNKSHITIENQELLIKSRQDYSERELNLQKAIAIFKDNSETLYSESGTLMVDLMESGYKFDVSIKKAKSQGVNYMKVLCYDLMLMELGKQRKSFPDFLIHDSTIFDGVDERQIAKALLLAKQKSDEFSFQYICLMNSDTVPFEEFSDEFTEVFNNSVVMRISDESDESGLMGIKF